MPCPVMYDTSSDATIAKTNAIPSRLLRSGLNPVRIVTRIAVSPARVSLLVKRSSQMAAMRSGNEIDRWMEPLTRSGDEGNKRTTTAQFPSAASVFLGSVSWCGRLVRTVCAQYYTDGLHNNAKIAHQ